MERRQGERHGTNDLPSDDYDDTVSSEQAESFLIGTIDELLGRRISIGDFYRVYGDSRYIFAVMASPEIDQDRQEFFADIWERIGWTCWELSHDLDDGYISEGEFREWLELKRARYPNRGAGDPPSTIDEPEMTSAQLEERLLVLVDSYLARAEDWTSFANSFASTWRQGFATVRPTDADDALHGYSQRVDAFIPAGRRRFFGQILELRKLATDGPVDERMRRWGYRTNEEATARLRELRSEYRARFGL